MKKEEAWYVVVTKENENACSDFRGTRVDVGQLVGIVNRNGNFNRGSNPSYIIAGDGYTFNREITTKEFYRKIGLIKNISYEIY